MSLEFTVVDAFTSNPFSGNPAAVCILDEAISDDLMQRIALEINLSETAFLYSEGIGFRLRWFTPKAEVKLCGHGTLASAHALWEQRAKDLREIEFYTLSGTLIASKEGDDIKLNFPIEPVIEADLPAELLKAIGVIPIFTGKTDVRYFVELPTANDVRNLSPDLARISQYHPGRIIVTAQSDAPEFDFISRYFAPGIGIPEDPVTGSAHCALAEYWSRKLVKNEFSAYQASSRGGALKIKLNDKRVDLLGKAVTVFRGKFAINLS